MSRRTDEETLKRWSDLTETERQFLLVATEIDDSLPHSEGLSKVLPLFDWRPVGRRCGLNEQAAAEVVATLLAKKLLWRPEGEADRIGVLGDYLVADVASIRRARRWRRFEVAAILVTVLITLAYYSLYGG